MSSISTLLEQLPSNDLRLWTEIGTELRLEQVRFSAEVNTHTPDIIECACSAILEAGDTPLMVVRALVNLVADNDLSRSFLTLDQNSSCITLWSRLSQMLCGSDVAPDSGGDPASDSAKLSATIIVLILQFFTFTENVKHHREHFMAVNVLPSIAVHVSANLSEEGAELLNHFLDNPGSALTPENVGGQHVMERIIRTCIDAINSVLRSLSIDDDADELVLTFATLIYNLSGLLREVPPQIAEWLTRINVAITSVPVSFESSIRIKRNFFATIGILSSLINVATLDFNSFARIVDAAIVNIYQSHDMYVFSGACATIGNCVTSTETHSIVKARIEAAHPLRDFLTTFFDRVRIDDPVQLQSIHAINNLVDSEIAPLIMDHAAELLEKFVKPAIDNQSLYPDPARFVFGLARKILRVHFIPSKNMSNIMDYRPLWSMLVNDGQSNQSSHLVGLLVLQAYVNSEHVSEIFPDDAQFFAALIENGVNLPQGALSIDAALESLKSVGMLMHVLSSKGGWQWLVPRVYDNHTILVNKVVVPLNKLLNEAILSGLSENQVFVNNTLFVAATVVKLCDQWLLSGEDDNAFNFTQINETKNVAIEIARSLLTKNH